jgi:hypothetical protein
VQAKTLKRRIALSWVSLRLHNAASRIPNRDTKLLRNQRSGTFLKTKETLSATVVAPQRGDGDWAETG